MSKIIYLLLTVCLFTSCEQDNDTLFLSIPDEDAQIVQMSVEVGLSANYVFSPIIYASQMVVDWGDGSQPWEYVNPDSTNIGTSMLKPLKYTYASSGDYNVNVRAVKITRLDISMDSARQSINTLQLTDCRHLKSLSCKGQTLKSVDVNTAGLKLLELSTLSVLESLSISDCDSLLTVVLYKNPLLTTVNLTDNPRMSAPSLNALFQQLPEATSDVRTITLTNNAGDATCDKSIATQKGWTVKVVSE